VTRGGPDAASGPPPIRSPLVQILSECRQRAEGDLACGSTAAAPRWRYRPLHCEAVRRVGACSTWNPASQPTGTVQRW